MEWKPLKELLSEYLRNAELLRSRIAEAEKAGDSCRASYLRHFLDNVEESIRMMRNDCCPVYRSPVVLLLSDDDEWTDYT